MWPIVSTPVDDVESADELDDVDEMAGDFSGKAGVSAFETRLAILEAPLFDDTESDP